ncbi:MAG TPA: orotate phosphoribosyltransferase [Gemmatimonadales bacterium]|nr:orotate phosphoribosyltransferase [Gemmatimonadales bacterium]
MSAPTHAALVDLLRERSVRHGDFVLASGARSSWYIDCRLTTMSAAGQALIGPLALTAIRAAGWQPRSVGGLTMGADPVAYAIAAASAGTTAVIDAFSVRKEAKAHGTGRRIEGNFAAGWDVVLIEDVITSGGSALTALDAVRREGGNVLGVLALVDREAGGREKIAATGVAVHALVRASELGVK